MPAKDGPLLLSTQLLYQTDDGGNKAMLINVLSESLWSIAVSDCMSQWEHLHTD